ncbi:MAG: LacI family DNA-binding transcriptional regulator, partial [Kiritimatiellae bacterium]|nr:LacI family DNA-binding transcriptional regulator [Kiritimatiellia bacterium]
MKTRKRRARQYAQHGPTLRDIAKRAGVTGQTVSLALNNREGVSEKRRRQIVRLANRMGYYPREAARMLASASTGQIGAICAHRPGDIHFAGLFGMMLDRFIEACEAADRRYHIEFLYPAGNGRRRG